MEGEQNVVVPRDRSIEASNARLAKYLENILKEVEAGRLPVSVSPVRCERFNFLPLELNAKHEVEDIEGIQEVVRKINLLFVNL
jgi:hypothetical protein